MPLVLVVTLLIPLVQSLTHFAPEKSLYGYTDPVPEKPTSYVRAFFNKKLQLWVEQYFNSHLGFRGFLIRSFNELNFALFHETHNSKIQIIATKKHGLYSNLAINGLNSHILNKKSLEQQYQEDAEQLLKVQNFLESQGKYFTVIIASSKIYVYPEELGDRYLVGGSSHLFERAVDFATIYKKAGVHVIDSGPLLRDLVKNTGIETHPASGVHWNLYAGCVVAAKVLNKAQKKIPNILQIDCGKDQQIKPSLFSIDTDVYQLLNVWSGHGLLATTTVPTVSVKNPAGLRPNIVMIGDSFSDQIFFAWQSAQVYSEYVISGYFRARSVFSSSTETNNSIEGDIQKQIMADITKGDLVILEMVDYNVPRRTYGFADYFLGQSEFRVAA